MKSKDRNIDMTTGSIPGNIIKFALPLLAGNLFQQFYNIVDTYVIGQTKNNAAYAAVGSMGPITNMIIGLFLGLSSGAGVVISQFYGAKNYEKVRSAVHTAIKLTLLLCVLFTAVGLFVAPLTIKILVKGAVHDHPDNAQLIYSSAKDYLTIYFAGVTGLMIYNMGSGILRAVGDSRKPFYFLVVSTITNIGLDLLFVRKFGMAADGVALATIISQGVSALLITVTLLKTKSVVRVEPKMLRIDRGLLKSIVRIGVPASIQMAITSFSNIFVQSYIMGADGQPEYLMGGWTTYTRIDQFIFLPVQSVALAVMTFVGQNLGVNDIKRAKKGTFIAYLMTTGVTVGVIATVLVFARQLAAVFNSDENVVHYSEMLLRHLTPFYILTCVNQVYSSSLRGAGDTRAPMIIMLSSFVVFRQIYLFVVSRYISNALLPLAYSYPAGWILCALCTMLYYRFCKFGKHRVSAAGAAVESV